MKFDRIYLDNRWPDCYLDVYLADPLPQLTRKALLVIPGGGYGIVCSDREGEPVALAFLPYGCNCFLLHYSTRATSEECFPNHLAQASLAMHHIRQQAQAYGIDPRQVYAVGFSAGGHLAGCLATMWHRQEVYDLVPMPLGDNRPTGAMLIYPVVTGVWTSAHMESFRNLLGEEKPTPQKLEQCSLENWVDEKTSPVFMVHTANDQLVPVENALCLASAFARAKRSFELHIYPDGPHGVALGNEITRCGEEKWENPAIAQWVSHAVLWMKQQTVNSEG